MQFADSHTDRTKVGIRIREAKAEDCDLYFRWANDPDVRANSFHSEPIPLEMHRVWFSKKLGSPQAFLYVVLLDGEEAGQVRLEQESSTLLLHFSVAAEYRGRGLGKAILSEALRLCNGQSELLDRAARVPSGARTIEGHVKQENRASVRAFLAAGYREQDRNNDGPCVFRAHIGSD